MKKIILLMTAIALFSASAASAAGTVVSTYATLNYKASKSVVVVASAAAQTFAAVSKHLNGTRTFGVTSGDTRMYYSESVAAGTDITTSTITASDSSAFSGWSAQ